MVNGVGPGVVEEAAVFGGVVVLVDARRVSVLAPASSPLWSAVSDTHSEESGSRAVVYARIRAYEETSVGHTRRTWREEEKPVNRRP